VRSLAFSFLSGKENIQQSFTLKISGTSELRRTTYDILEDLQSGATIRIERYNDGREPVLMAATYILVALEEGADSGDVFQHLMGMLRYPKPILWLETCFGFEQYIAIHFDSHDFAIFDELLSFSRQLLLKSTPDYFNIVKAMSTSAETKIEDSLSASHTVLTSFTQESTSLLTIIDSPICKTHHYFKDCVIRQDNCYDDYYGTDHGTFVAGVVMQINSNVDIYSFPTFFINAFIESRDIHEYKDIELFNRDGSMMLSGIGKISAALTSFLNSETSKVANLSLGIRSTGPEVTPFLTPLMSKLRSKGSILVVATGNGDKNKVGTDIDRSVDNLFAPFVDVESGENNIVFVAAVDPAGQLASFSNYGRTKVMLAAPGVDIRSCSFPPNKFKVDSGTSFAAPQVAVTLAMMVARFPYETHTQIIDRLRSSVDRDDTLQMTTISDKEEG